MDQPSTKELPKPKPSFFRRRRIRLLLSYAPDWIITVGIAILFWRLDAVKGFYRRFSLTDTTIQFPYTVQERIPYWLLLIFAGACPLVIMPAINILTVRSLWDWHNSWLGLLLSVSLTGTLTTIVKITVGRPRPDLIARCQPEPGSANAAVFGLVSYTICQQPDPHVLDDGFRSFFSGHTSIGFAGLGFLFYYAAGKMHLFDERGQTAKAWTAAVPLVGATLVGITRTMDYRHHWQDVFIGGVVGLLVAHFSYRQYYPPLNHVMSHKPYSPRIPVEEGVATTNVEGKGPIVGTTTATPAGQVIGRPSTQGRRSPDDPEIQQANVEDEGIDGTLPRPSVDLTDTWQGNAGRKSTNSRKGTNMV